MSGKTIALGAVPNFYQLTQEAARDTLYNVVVPACEAKGVMLSSYGNHAGRGSLVTVAKYNADKAEHKLFNVERVQIAFAALGAMLQNTSQYKSGSYGLKHQVEKLQGEYISNGDLIAAMLLAGYQARFGKRTEALAVNCEFKVKFVAA